MTTTLPTSRLVIASNRGPVERSVTADGRVVRQRGAGGLIAVLGPAAAAARGVWVASALTEADAGAAAVETVDLAEGPVGVRTLRHDPDVYRDYYGVVATELLWFLHHHLFDLRTEPVFDARLHTAWRHYRQVNDAFAAACADHAAPGGTVLIQDYHLALAPRRLRALRPDVRSAHFTMTPWAAPDHFATLPDAMARELLAGMLGADMVSFLVPRWARAFLDCCARVGLEVDRERAAVRDEDGHWAAVRCFPVGVDGAELAARAATDGVAAHRRRLAARVGDTALVLRIDRMDPAKNVLRGLAAYAELLEREPARRGRVVHLVHAYTSRGDLPAYRRYAEQVRALVDDINRRYGDTRWRPVVLETGNDFELGIAEMSLADVLVVNPLRDGMNLVAKEAAVVSERGVALVLSELAGAADDLAEGCALVDPLDVSALATQLSVALDLPVGERMARLARLRRGAVALPPREWLAAVTRELERL